MLFLKKNYIYFVIIFLAFVGCKHSPTELLVVPAPKITSTNDTGACDTANVTYSITIKKVLSDNCLRCHGSTVYTTKGSGYNYDDYTAISTQANNGNLAKAINHAPGALPMPLDLPSSKISDCSIRKFMIWIAAGAPNN